MFPVISYCITNYPKASDLKNHFLIYHNFVAQKFHQGSAGQFGSVWCGLRSHRRIFSTWLGWKKSKKASVHACALVGTTGDWSHRALLLHVLAEPSLWLSIWVVWFLAWSLRAPGNQGRSCWSYGGGTRASLSPYSVGQSSHRPEQNQEGKWPPLLRAAFHPQGALLWALSSVAVCRNLCIFKGFLDFGFGLTWLKQCPLSSEGVPRRVNKVNFCVRGPWSTAARTSLACASPGELVEMQTLTQQVCSEA